MEAQLEYVARCIHIFCMFGADLYAQSVLINKFVCIEAQLKKKLTVRCWLGMGVVCLAVLLKLDMGNGVR